MARTIELIQGDIIAELREKVTNLSTSKIAQWRLLTYVVAVAIHSFEVILDLFRAEITEKTLISTSGTMAWYSAICRAFQIGHKLIFDPKTGIYGYELYDEAARIVSVAAVTKRERALYIKVARENDAGALVPLTDDEYREFVNYIDLVGIAGTPCSVTSTTSDSIKYDITAYYDPAYPQASVRYGVDAALETFKTSLNFNSRFYRQRLVDAVMSVDGVVTADTIAILHKTSESDAYIPAGVVVELLSGYFNYDEDSTITYTPTENI